MSFIAKCVVSLGMLASLRDAAPLENHLQLSSEPHYDVGNPWIGSHTLKFTPNPFLLNALDPNIISHGKQLAQDDTLDSNPIEVVSTGESPISIESTTQPSPNQYNNNYVPQQKMGKRGRKLRRRVKGRRRIPSSMSSKKIPRNPATRYKTKRDNVDETKRRFFARKPRGKVFTFPTPEHQIKPEIGEALTSEVNFGKVDFLPIDRVSTNPPIYKWRGLKAKTRAGQSLLPTITPTPVTVPPSEATSFSPGDKTEELVGKIKTPPPIKPEVVEPKKNLIPVDIILNHADKLDPSFFRNIILKTMMDKLAEVEVVKNGPQLASSSEKKSDTQKLS